MKTIAFIQARMGSSRLPGKVLMDLAGKSVLQRIIERVERTPEVDEVVVLTTLESADIELVAKVSEWGYRVFCGSENDVLDRFWQAAKILKPSRIVRITGDCPVMDSEIISKVLNAHSKFDVDYCSNGIVESYPDGLDVEVFNYATLEKVHACAKLPSEREHVTPYIRSNKVSFSFESIVSEVDYHQERWTLDTEDDFQFINELYKGLVLKNEFFGMKTILNYLKYNPNLSLINKDIVRNEGYLKSLQEDEK